MTGRSGRLERMRRGVAATGPVGDRLAAECTEVLAAHADVELPRTDLVHGDFRAGNVLFIEADGEPAIAGVIDIEALGSGTRVFDYATLLDSEGIDAEARALLVEAGGAAAGRESLLACFAWVALEVADFARRADSGSPRLDERMRQLSERLRQLERTTY